MKRPTNNVTEATWKRFYAGQRDESVPLCMNDPVDVIAGGHQGRVGAVISIESVGDDPEFLVEFGDTGEDAVLRYSTLNLIAARPDETPKC
jgi:hypothetical protein